MSVAARTAQAVVARIQAAGGLSLAVQADVGDEAQVMAMFAHIDQALPAWGACWAGLVNSAGVVDQAQRVEAMSVQRLERMMRINVIGALLCAREAAKCMSTRHGGHGGAIVNVSSIGALTGSPFTFMDYAASKGAMDTFNQGLATELAAYGVRVNGVRPGLIDTDIHASAGMDDRVNKVGAKMPVGRAGSALEVAEVIAFLLSPASSYVTGSMVNVSGGVR